MLRHISGMLLVMGLISTFQGAVGINVGTNLTNVNLKLQPSQAVPWTTARRNLQAVESAQSLSPHMHTYSPTLPLRDSFLHMSAMCPTYDNILSITNNSILPHLPLTTSRHYPLPHQQRYTLTRLRGNLRPHVLIVSRNITKCSPLGTVSTFPNYSYNMYISLYSY